jgi:hypothetical protein
MTSPIGSPGFGTETRATPESIRFEVYAIRSRT